MLLLVIGLSQVSTSLGIQILIIYTSFAHSFKKIVYVLQYMKHVRLLRDFPIFERFPVLVCVPIIWIYSIVLTACGAYRDRPDLTQQSCRTDRAGLVSTAPWFVSDYTFAFPFARFLALWNVNLTI